MASPKMQRAHFQLIADAIRDYVSEHSETDGLASLFADRLARTNPAFDRARFISACRPADCE